MANNIKCFRIYYDLSQRELARMVGVSNTAISDIESGKHVPSVILAMKIAKVLNTNVYCLFWLKD